MDTQSMMSIMQLILTGGNLCVMIYAFKSFLQKPHDLIDERITALEVKMKDIDYRLRKGNDKFEEQDKANEVMIMSILALIEFEIQFCITEHKELSENLRKAKENLNSYLSRR